MQTKRILKTYKKIIWKNKLEKHKKKRKSKNMNNKNKETIKENETLNIPQINKTNKEIHIKTNNNNK